MCLFLCKAKLRWFIESEKNGSNITKQNKTAIKKCSVFFFFVKGSKKCTVLVYVAAFHMRRCKPSWNQFYLVSFLVSAINFIWFMIFGFKK